jgi:cell division protease FtsH
MTDGEEMEAIRYGPALRDRVEADLPRLQRRADALIRKHRDAVVAIAKALRAKRHLRGDAMRAIFEKHRRPAPVAKH